MAKFVIEKERMYIENANRAAKEGYITPDNTEPDSKNPIIASFFRNIGYADQLGSGVRNLFKYSKFYSGKDPEFKEGDIFRITVPLDDEFSFDFGNPSADKMENIVDNAANIADKSKSIADNTTNIADKSETVAEKQETNAEKLARQQKAIYEFVEREDRATTKDVIHLLQVKERQARNIIYGMISQGILEKQGNSKATVYVLKK